jgi:hypothetical protein
VQAVSFKADQAAHVFLTLTGQPSKEHNENKEKESAR